MILFQELVTKVNVLTEQMHEVYHAAKELGTDKSFSTVERMTAQTYMKMIEKAGNAMGVDVKVVARDDQLVENGPSFDV